MKYFRKLSLMAFLISFLGIGVAFALDSDDSHEEETHHINTLTPQPQKNSQNTHTSTGTGTEESEEPFLLGRTQERVNHNISTEFTRGVEGFNNLLKHGKFKSDKKLKKEKKKEEKKKLKKTKKEEKIDLEKGWQLVGSSPNRNTKKPISSNPKPQGFELLGDDYTFYNNMPALGNFDKATFLFTVELKSTNPGAIIQYYDGAKSVSSVPYNGDGEWAPLSIEFTVDAQKARFHRLYAAILGPVKNNDNPSVDVRNIQLLQKM